ncbi:hypothetical protein LJ754_03180 [Arthrobacter sp. zg-Y40]|uniref:hypothetical protein n=1 Tax=Arthrobacter sp. zg-Y40 TaxID=2886939 RepID=UPI001D15640D|nr:hypothetical protein [Arthrobacter sp. zg-Y40]MCC3278163.1 hypothetical protein [Arthrobacter sp. zg-Y40]
MTINNRTEEEQQRLNSHMRRKDVLEEVLFRSLHAKPATEEQVKRLLAVAPPEVFVLLDGLKPSPSPTGIPNEPLHENRIVQGFVGMVMERNKSAYRL